VTGHDGEWGPRLAVVRKLTAAGAALLLSLVLVACGDDGDGGDGGDAASDPGTSAAVSDEPTSATPSAGESESSEPEPSEPGASASSSAPAGSTVTCDYPPDGQQATVQPPPAQASDEGTVTATVTTSIGQLTFDLDAEGAPCTVNSFVSLADQGFFDGTTCHRLTTQGIFVLQCGDPTATGTGGPGYTIPDEFPPSPDYGPGTLAMANTGMPGSGGSQFFIVYDGEDTQLPPAYTIFGQVSQGLDLVADAAAQGTVEGGPDGTPAVPVDIEDVSIG
jgi:peptidyl-prolyl cis-trans isomerase B (cyclophilin B)